MENNYSDLIADLLYTGQMYLTSSFIILILLSILGALIYFLIIFFRHKNREEYSLDFVLLQVALPRENEIKIDSAEQLFSSLYAISKGGFFSFLKRQDHFTFEIAARPEDIRFYASVPKEYQDFFEKQIHGAYPGAEIKEVPEYNIFTENGKVVFTTLKLANAPYLPLKIYKDLPTDPLSTLTSAMSKMQEGEGAVIQYLITPANDKWKHAGRSYISNVKKRESNPEMAKYTTDARFLESLDNKCSKPGFSTIIRIVVCGRDMMSAKMHLDNIKGAFEQFSSETNHFKKARNFFKKAFMIDFIYRYQPILAGKSVLNTEELATVFHFPNKSVETPHIFWLNAKRAPAPAQIPKSGLYLGKSIYRGVIRQIYMDDDDRRRHVYIIGKTGVGKSELLKQMILQDIKEGKGVCFMDPHDTIDKLLELIPPERAEDVIYFDPSDTNRPMGLNMLEAYTEEQKHYVVTSIIGLMYKLYDPHQTGIIGPRFEHAIRNAMLTVMCEQGNTFIEVVRCLTDSAFVQQLLPKVQDPIVRRYWTDQIAQTADFHKSEVLDYIVSKFGRFVTNKMMRNIIGQSRSCFDFRKVMDEGKILLINLAKGKIGEENSQFLGLILVPKILMAAMSRQDIPEEKRRDFYLYVDEFQNFATPDFAQILSEARKYHLNLTVANQFIGQMEEEVKNAVFGNVGTLISFRVGVSDANYLQHEFQPNFNEADLLNIERYNAYVKTIFHNEPLAPFSLDMTKDMEEEARIRSIRIAEMIKKLSALKHGKDKNMIEAEIAQRARL